MNKTIVDKVFIPVHPINLMTINISNIERINLIDIWKIVSQKNSKALYKPSEITNRQQDYIFELSRFLDRRYASTLIKLLQVITDKENE